VLKHLVKLGLEYVDLFLIHAPELAAGRLESVWRDFEELREAGLTKYGAYLRPRASLLMSSCRSIGVSNFSKKDLEELFKVARFKPVVNQVSQFEVAADNVFTTSKIQFHPYNWAKNKELLEFHKKHGIVTEGYSSLRYVAWFVPPP
jgi:diketogulonate reductase-like aldo/keto reductase